MWVYRVFVIVLFMGLNACVAAPATRGGASVTTHAGDLRVDVRFGQDDRDVIRRYYQGQSNNKHKGKKTPPGLAKRETLPPGLQKQLERNGQLPPGLQGRALPSTLERSLSPLPPAYVRLRVGADVVLMHAKTRIIADVIRILD